MARIICPNCQHSFEPEDAISKSIELEMRSKMETEWRKRLDGLNAEKSKIVEKETELQNALQFQDEKVQQLVQAEKKAIQNKLEQDLRKSISSDFENELLMLKQSAAEQDEKLKNARQKELEYLQKEKALQSRAEEMDIANEKKLIEERGKLSEQIRREETERAAIKENQMQLKIREFEEKDNQQRKLIEEMKRKAEQGSMQLQGEVQELELENVLRNAFPFDLIREVGKGVRGADCIQTVRNNLGQECGHIIYESKRTQSFGTDWIEKLKADMRSQGAEIAVIVTQVMPKEMSCFGLRDGVWICTFQEVQALAAVLRDGIVRIYSAAKSQQNKGDKMHLLYDYLTGNEFAEQWKAVREVFMSMRQSIQRERDAMEKLWKAREKQLDKALLNAAGIKGNIEGIAGDDQALHLDFDLDETKLLD